MNSQYQTDRAKKLIDRLKAYSDQNILYFQAKELLSKEGYTEEDFTTASYDYQYGEKPPAIDILKQAVENNPRIADSMANEIINRDNEIERDEAIGDAIGMRSNILPATARYTSDFIHKIGWRDYILLIVAEFAIAIVIALIGLPSIFYSILAFVLTIFIIYKKFPSVK